MAEVCRQANAKRKQHRHAEAAVLYARGQAGRGCDPMAHANSLRHLGRGEEAAAVRLSVVLNAPWHPKRALHLPANEARVWRNIARDYRVAGALDQAWHAAEMAESLDPDSDAQRLLKANLYLDQGLLEQAEPELNGVAQQGTRYFLAQSRLLRAQGRPELALAMLGEIANTDKDKTSVQVMRTQLLLELARPRKARVSVQGRLYSTKSSNDTHLLARRVAYLMHLGLYPQARDSWALLQAMAPGAPLDPLAAPVQRTPSPW